MSVSNMKLFVEVGKNHDFEEEYVDELTRNLFREIRSGYDVESVSLEKKEVIELGAKSSGAFAIGSLVVEMLPALLPAITSFLKYWSERKKTPVKMKVEIGNKDIEIDFNSSDNSSHKKIEYILSSLNG